MHYNKIKKELYYHKQNTHTKFDTLYLVIIAFFLLFLFFCPSTSKQVSPHLNSPKLSFVKDDFPYQHGDKKLFWIRTFLNWVADEDEKEENKTRAIFPCYYFQSQHSFSFIMLKKAITQLLQLLRATYIFNVHSFVLEALHALSSH